MAGKVSFLSQFPKEKGGKGNSFLHHAATYGGDNY
jgi:hypothetical protein